MAWKTLGALTGAKPKPKRSAAGGEGQQSLRDALRARGGARNVESVTAAATDIEDNFEAREHSKMEWLNLQAFAPTSLQSIVDKIRQGEMPAGMALPAALQRRRKSPEGDDEAPPNGSDSDASEALSSTAPKPASGLRGALQARGGVRIAQPQQPPPAVAEGAPDGRDGAEGLSDSPSASVLASVAEEADEPATVGEDAAHEPAADASADRAPEEVADDAGVASDKQGQEPAATQPASFEQYTPPPQHAEVVTPEVAEEPWEETAAEPSAETRSEDAAPTAEPAVEASPPEPAAAPEEPAAAPEEPSAAPEEPSPAPAAEEAPAAEPPQERREPRPPAAEPKAAKVIASATGYPLAMAPTISRRKDEAPEPQPILAPAPPASLQPQKSQPGKLKELREFWGKGKDTVGFAGPQIAGARMSRGEAQATLQRLAAAGGDLDQVRMLRKIISELDDAEPPRGLVP